MRRIETTLWWGLLALTLLAFRPLSRLPVFADPVAKARLDEVDRQFEQRSYSEALDGYRKLLESGADLGDRRPESGYRYAVALGKTESWDRTLREAEAFHKRHPGTIWEARGQYWLGRLLMAVPTRDSRLGSASTRATTSQRPMAQISRSRSGSRTRT